MFWDIAIIVFSAVVVIGVAVKAVLDKRKGKTGCSACAFCSDCSDCSSCNGCSSKSSMPNKGEGEKGNNCS